MEETLAELSKLITSAHCSWTLWDRLFGRSSADEGTLLQTAAPIFFACARWHIAAGVVLALARLCDPAEQGSRRNLTMEHVLSTAEAQLGVGSDRYYDVARMMCAVQVIVRSRPFKLLRNRVLAHNDRDLLLGQSELDDLERETVGQAVRAAAAFEHRLRTLVAADQDSHSAREPWPPTTAVEPWVRDAEGLLSRLGGGTAKAL
jgi:hypothetical protein